MVAYNPTHVCRMFQSQIDVPILGTLLMDILSSEDAMPSLV